jgi:hypothetical protein
MAITYETIHKYQKYLIIFGSLCMIALGIGRFFNIIKGFHFIDYVINVYLM